MGKLVTILLIVVGLVLGFAGAYMAMPLIRPDYVSQLQSRLDSLSTEMEMDSTVVAVVDEQTDVPDPDEDSLTTLRQELETMRRQAAALTDHNARLSTRIDSMIGRKEAVAQLAATLGAVEDKELGALVQNLSDDLLLAVYTGSNRKNQARILSNIPAEQAARVIQGLFDSTRDK